MNGWFYYSKDFTYGIPENRHLICYCPEWNNHGYVVAQFDGNKFWYDEDHNQCFDDYVEKWSLFLEAN